MSRYDPHLIAALAEGSLEPDEAARVERELAADPVALAELEAQRTAIAALRSTPDAQLTDIERAGMRAAIADALGLAERETTPASAGPRRIPWGSLGVAAAALTALIAVVPIVGLLNTGGDGAADATLAPAAVSTSTLMADGEEAADPPTEEAVTDSAPLLTDDNAFDAGSEAPGDDPTGFGFSTTVPTRSTTTEGIDETTTTTSEAITEGTSTTAAGETDAATQELVDELALLLEDQEALEEVSGEPTEDTLCWVEDTDKRGGEAPGDRWFFEYDNGEQAVIVYFLYGEEGAPGPFSVYEVEGCDEVVEIP